MFVGAINSTVRKFLAKNAHVFQGRNVVIGCSGNFISENVLTKYAKPAGVFSNDTSLYSCMLGRWLIKKSVDFEIADREFAWVEDYFADDTFKLGSLMVFIKMLEFEKRNNPHRERMWIIHKDNFSDMVLETVDRLERLQIKITDFYAGDVFKHFDNFAEDPNAIFCYAAPTSGVGHSLPNARLNEIIKWDAPTHSSLDTADRDRLFSRISTRDFLWYDERKFEKYPVIMKQRIGSKRTIYLYSNVVTDPGIFTNVNRNPLPLYPLAGSDFVFKSKMKVGLQRIKTTELACFKDAYLGKNISHVQGMWAFMIVVADKVIGFMEFDTHRYPEEGDAKIYLMADFPVSGTRYKMLSKLVLMMTVSKETRAVLERLSVNKILTVFTTAFTDKSVSMKYRSVYEIVKRGESDSGQKFINYEADFNNLSWKETLNLWKRKNLSKVL